MTKIRVNVRSVANTKAARYEKRNGRDVVIVPSATLPDDVVMNGIKYPADEIEKSYLTLNRTPAPLGHPTVNGAFLSAFDPEAQNMNGIGAWNENVRRENGKVYLDKVIDLQRANSTEGGKRVLDAINAGGPVHTSTGLYCNLEECSDGAEYVARNIAFDHDAILLDEQGAATPDQGVGLFVNAKGGQDEIQVINSRVEWAEDDLAWAAEHLLDSAERLDKAKEREALLPRLVEALRGIMSGGPAATNENVQKEEPMDNDTKEALEAVNAKVDALATSMGEAIANAVKPLVDAQNAAREAQEAQDKAAHAALVNKVKEAAIPGFSEEVANTMDKAALEALLNMHEAKRKAAPLAGGFFNAFTQGDPNDVTAPLGGTQ